jgi:hypothetical protein
MNSRHLIIFCLQAALALASATVLATGNDPLHKRVFRTSLSETKNGVVAKKVIASEITFKNGSLFSEFLYEKFGYKWLRYRVSKDTTFTDQTGTEVRLIDIESVITDENNQTIYLNLETSEWDIDGTIKITKNDKLKKYYDVAGREKGGKPKKEKKKRQKPPVIEIKQE